MFNGPGLRRETRYGVPAADLILYDCYAPSPVPSFDRFYGAKSITIQNYTICFELKETGKRNYQVVY